MPYAFAVELRPIDTPAGPLEVVVVLCPWCGDEETVTRQESACGVTDHRYVVAILAGTAVMA